MPPQDYILVIACPQLHALDLVLVGFFCFGLVFGGFFVCLGFCLVFLFGSLAFVFICFGFWAF